MVKKKFIKNGLYFVGLLCLGIFFLLSYAPLTLAQDGKIIFDVPNGVNVFTLKAPKVVMAKYNLPKGGFGTNQKLCLSYINQMKGNSKVAYNSIKETCKRSNNGYMMPAYYSGKTPGFSVISAPKGEYKFYLTNGNDAISLSKVLSEGEIWTITEFKPKTETKNMTKNETEDIQIFYPFNIENISEKILIYPKKIEGDIIFVHEEGDVLGGPIWNEHSPRIVTDGKADYAIYTHLPLELNARKAILLKREKSGNWTQTGNTFNFVHQPPALLMDNLGNLHIVFNTLGKEDVNIGKFHHYVLLKNTTSNSTEISEYFYMQEFNEFTNYSNGYIGAGYDWVNDEVYMSSFDLSYKRKLFKEKQNSSIIDVIPSREGDMPSRPIIAASSNGNKYYIDTELVKDWTLKPGKGSSSRILLVYLIQNSTTINLIWNDSVEEADGVNSWIWLNDAASDTSGNIFVLYNKYNSSEQNNTYLMKISSSNTIEYVKEIGKLTAESQIQVNSAGDIFLIEPLIGNKLLLIYKLSKDGEITKIYKTNIPGLLNNTDFIGGVQIMKKWHSPEGYNPDRVYGVYGGGKYQNPAENNYQQITYYLGSIAIDISPDK